MNPDRHDLFAPAIDTGLATAGNGKSRAGVLEIGSNDNKVIGLLLKRRRQLNNLTVRDMAERLGSSSKNAYARYEQGKTLPSIDKLQELLSATGPVSDVVISEARLA